MCKNPAQFGQERYKIAPVALSEREDSGWLEINSDNLGASKLVAGSGPKSVSIEIWSIKKRLTNLAFVPVTSEADCTTNDYVGILDASRLPSAAGG